MGGRSMGSRNHHRRVVDCHPGGSDTHRRRVDLLYPRGQAPRRCRNTRSGTARDRDPACHCRRCGCLDCVADLAGHRRHGDCRRRTHHGYSASALAGTRCSPHLATHHSHSMVAGGFEEMSYATRLIPGTSLITLDEILARMSYGILAQSAVMASSLVTALMMSG